MSPLLTQLPGELPGNEDHSSVPLTLATCA
jgi:hypothetical protein